MRLKIELFSRHVDEEAQTLLADYRDNRARRKMLDNRATYMRYELEWMGREGLSPETHEDYLMGFINHFYKNVLRLVDRAMMTVSLSVFLKSPVT